jgi:hypothetical protein
VCRPSAQSHDVPVAAQLYCALEPALYPGGQQTARPNASAGPAARRPLASLNRVSDQFFGGDRSLQRVHRCTIADDSPDTKMGNAERLEMLRLVQPVRLASPLGRNVGLQAERRDVSSLLIEVIPEPIDNPARLLAGRQQWHPAVAESRNSPQEPFCESAANPNWNRAIRTRSDADAIECMPSALKGDEFLRPELPEERNLLLLPRATRVEIFVERLVFRKVPTDTDTQTQALAREEIYFGGLFGDERRLALRKNQDARSELDSLRQAGKEREKRERLVELAVVEVWRRGKAEVPPGKSVGVRTEYVVICGQVIKPCAFGRLSKVPNRDRVGSNLGLWKRNSEFHKRYPTVWKDSPSSFSHSTAL